MKGIVDGVAVLIETLWNVKEVLENLKKAAKFRINRNIVECKEEVAENDKAHD